MQLMQWKLTSLVRSLDACRLSDPKLALFNEFLLNVLCYSFERELKNKLSEKTRGAQSEEQVLMKAFKYFDLNDNGTVEPDEFAKAIEKIGIQIPTRQVSLLSI